jgi:hypothetical protein
MNIRPSPNYLSLRTTPSDSEGDVKQPRRAAIMPIIKWTIVFVVTPAEAGVHVFCLFVLLDFGTSQNNDKYGFTLE